MSQVPRRGSFESERCQTRALLTVDFNGSPDVSDAALVGKVRQGNAAAFEALVRRHLPVAHGLALSIVRDGDDADDVCQDGFILALERIGQLRDPALFRVWLLSIVRNRALNFRASLARRSGPEPEALNLPSTVPAPDRDVEGEELHEEVRRAAEGLTDMQVRVFLLHDIEGLNHGEIAESLGISRGSSRVHLHMARRLVKSRLSGLYSGVF